MTEKEKEKAKQVALVDLSPRAIVHLRAQHEIKRLGLIFGAGISVDLDYPNWENLVKAMADRPEVCATDIWEKLKEKGSDGRPVTRSLATVTQMLFDKFRRGKIAEKNLSEPLTYVDERRIKTEWMKLLHRQIYQNKTEEDRIDKLKSHPYLNAFTQIIKRSPLTVTYNFDDSIEQMLALARTPDEAETTRGYEMIDQPSSQCRSSSSVIYHPNGYLPAVFNNGASGDVVFADDSFQDQLISAANGKYLHLSTHLFRNTCLLIGLSLDDSTLQSLLRQNAVQNPGNVHYIIQFTPKGSTRDKEVEDTIFKANFESFNLYTLFLNSEEIQTLATLIEMKPSTFASKHARAKPKYVYYIIGSVGSGKSTAAANLRNLITYDEWIDEKKDDLAKPENQVETEKISTLDKWIDDQFHKKNFALQRSREGIHVVDRAPLDPLTFTDAEKRPERAKALIDKITDGGAWKIQPGHIIELSASLDDVRIRNSLKHKFWPDEDYQQLLKRIQEVYGSIDRTVISTHGRSAAQVAKQIARVIFLGKYNSIDIGKVLSGYVNSGEQNEKG